MLQTSAYNFQCSADRLGLDNSIRERLLFPKEKNEIFLNPLLSNNKSTVVRAFIVRHNDALGPAKGGIRMAADVTLDDVTALSMEMTWKTSLIGVPFGGGKSGISLDLHPN